MMRTELQLPEHARAAHGPHHEDGLHEAAADVAYQRVVLANVVLVGAPRSRDWVLVDAGVYGSGRAILDAAANRFGRPPAAIVLTHGHFDHVGVLRAMAEHWDVPIYAHPAEFPYLNGSQSYPPPDPTVGGGLMSLLSPLYPRGPVDVSQWLRPLGDGGRVPPMPDWQWIHTPGHTRGHISLWRDRDRTIIAGDAFITTRQESAYAVMTQEGEMHGPPMYYTEDWPMARSSVQRLAALEPELAVTGHGRAFRGPHLRLALHTLARRFDELALPDTEKAASAEPLRESGVPVRVSRP
jgi:glyoxylase-like metal-dependent hydrolase (beta-lactamase superfamily II)